LAKPVVIENVKKAMAQAASAKPQYHSGNEETLGRQEAAWGVPLDLGGTNNGGQVQSCIALRLAAPLPAQIQALARGCFGGPNSWKRPGTGSPSDFFARMRSRCGPCFTSKNGWTGPVFSGRPH